LAGWVSKVSGRCFNQLTQLTQRTQLVIFELISWVS
jgi:hypothetical protein